jgi:hypothetical protein
MRLGLVTYLEFATYLELGEWLELKPDKSKAEERHDENRSDSADSEAKTLGGGTS